MSVEIDSEVDEMADVQSSKSQTRLLRLVGLTSDGTYAHAARVLDAAWLPADGIPAGLTWREAGKLSDDELLARLPKAVAAVAPVATTAAVKAAATAERQSRHWAHRQPGAPRREEIDEYDELSAAADADR